LGIKRTRFRFNSRVDDVFSPKKASLFTPRLITFYPKRVKRK